MFLKFSKKLIENKKKKRLEMEQNEIEKQLLLKQIPSFINDISKKYNKNNASLEEIIKDVSQTTPEPLRKSIISIL